MKPLGVVLPDVSFDGVSRVAKASLFVWAKQTALADITDLVFNGLPVALLRPKAPVGIQGTLSWLEQVARHGGPGSGSASALAIFRKEAPWQRELARLRQQTGRWTVAFVAGPEEADILLDTVSMYGFSILDVVLEMGFKVKFLAYGKPGDYSAHRDRIRKLGSGARISWGYFTAPGRLASLISGKDIGIVFSHFTADPRVAAAGKATFSEVSFEMGVSGFLSTAWGFLRACSRRPLAGWESYLGSGPWP